MPLCGAAACLILACSANGTGAGGAAPPPDVGIHKVKHVIVVMQENHSFDSYFGALVYAPGSPYHAPAAAGTSCDDSDHCCVDGLSCTADAGGGLRCSNANLDENGGIVAAFHNPSRCVPDPDHSWTGVHRQINYDQPNAARSEPRMDGFVRVSHSIQPMGFYTQDDLPFYYDLAQRFAIDDRFFAPVLGPTFPNRAYLMAATSFGHLVTSDQIPPLAGFKPIHGTIWDLLDRNHVSWVDYYQDVPQGASFRVLGSTLFSSHFAPLSLFLAHAAGRGELPSVAFVDPNFGAFREASRNDEEAPTDIQRGQAFVSRVINAVRNGPRWADSVIFVVYDEHGGLYDHVPPPPAIPPDTIEPGQCADLSDPPASLLPGGGAECSSNHKSSSDVTVAQATALCPALAARPTGLYPADCAHFDQYGVRVPFVAVSPFSRPQYVSHTIADHTSILAFIETAFLPPVGGQRQYLTARDQSADNLLDLFDFDGSPSLHATVGTAMPPADDCTPR
ncbi:MAG TPA: alkaline phosphatase family protein [Kofleriaceae bacterium]